MVVRAEPANEMPQTMVHDLIDDWWAAEGARVMSPTRAEPANEIPQTMVHNLIDITSDDGS